MTFIDLFSDTAVSYAATRPTYPDALFARLAALAPGTSRAWDCGTGNGQAAIGLARWFDQVDATDASADQIANAMTHERIRYAVAPSEASGLADSSIDLVCVAQALHWWSLHQLVAYYLTWSATRTHLKLHGEAFLSDALARLQAAWGDPTRVRSVVMPLALRLGTVKNAA